VLNSAVIFMRTAREKGTVIYRPPEGGNASTRSRLRLIMAFASVLTLTALVALAILAFANPPSPSSIAALAFFAPFLLVTIALIGLGLYLVIRLSRKLTLQRTSGARPTAAESNRRDCWRIVGFAGFILAGLVALPLHRGIGIITIALFGSFALLVAIRVILRLKFFRPVPLRVEIVGGVPIRPSRVIQIIAGIWFIGLGVLMLIFGWPTGYLFDRATAYVPCGVAMVILGCYILYGLFTGRLWQRYLQFDPSGITFGRRGYSFTVHWDNIAGITSELEPGPVLLIYIRNIDLVSIYPPERRTKAFHILNWDALRNPIILNPAQYGMDLKLLMEALDRYLIDPSAREQLSRRALPKPAE
jgi:hypothetical protein